MQRIPTQRAGRRQSAESIQIVVLYETGTGRIVHQQVTTTIAGGRHVPPEEATVMARQQAAIVGLPVHLLRAQVSTDPRHAVGRHRIDPATGEFVAVPMPELRLDPTDPS